MLAISDDDIAQRLRGDNPWWSGSVDLTAFPYNLRRRSYYPVIKSLLARRVRRALILLGARRVGKTTLLRQLIGEASVTQQFGPVLFASIDTPTYSGMPLARYLDFFVAQCPHDESAPRLVVFDEIQYLSDWERHLKDLVDRYPQTSFVASGSAGAALKRKSDESGAGRFTDFVLPPLTFAEFIAFSEVDSALIRDAEPNDREAVLGFTTSNITELNRHLLDYINYGGYPEVVTSREVRDDIARTVGRDIVDKVLLRDLPSLYGIQNIPELNRLFTMLAFNTGQEVSLDALSQNSGVAKNTISRYIDYLEAAFLIFRIRRLDETARRFVRQRGFKVYLTNSSMRSALFGPVGESSRHLGALVETVAFGQWLHSPELQNLHYARWADGEVDIVRLHPATQKPTWAYDIKWSDRVLDRPEEAQAIVSLARSAGLRHVGVSAMTAHGTVPTEGVTIRVFPTALQCYSLGVRLLDQNAVIQGYEA
jgi:uncharacterized protein